MFAPAIVTLLTLQTPGTPRAFEKVEISLATQRAIPWKFLKGLRPVGVFANTGMSIRCLHPISWVYEIKKPSAWVWKEIRREYARATPSTALFYETNSVRSDLSTSEGCLTNALNKLKGHHDYVNKASWTTIYVTETPRLWNSPVSWSRQARKEKMNDPKPPVPFLKGCLPIYEEYWFASGGVGVTYIYEINSPAIVVAGWMSRELVPSWQPIKGGNPFVAKGCPAYEMIDSGNNHRGWQIAAEPQPQNGKKSIVRLMRLEMLNALESKRARERSISMNKRFIHADLRGIPLANRSPQRVFRFACSARPRI